MNAEEFDTSLTDLETRVDRLRALYENWFRGYEKSEPFVARKEVERRVYTLRKDLPRNTALRFRYHQLFQRYTTLTSYWQRTARQIEEGTHRLQLQRLRRRRTDEGMGASLPPRPNLETDAPPPAFELNLDETLDVQKLLDEADFDLVASALERGKPTQAQPAPGATPAARTVGRFARPSAANDALQRPSLSFDLGDANERAAASLLPGSLRPGQPSVPAASVSKAPSTPLDKLPDVPKAPRLPVGPMLTPPMLTTVPSVSLAPPSAGAAGPSIPARPPLPGGPSLPPGQASAASLPPGRGAVPRPPAPPVPGTPSRAAPPPIGQRPPPPPVPSIAARAPTTGTVPVPPGAVRPVPPPPRPSLPNVPAPANVAPSPTPSAPPRKPATSPAPTGPTFTEQRMRRIYDEYAAARRKNNEAEVRFETLAGSIQKMLPDLHKKHQGKQIDFEVVVKDGRVGLKPRAT